MGTDETLEQRRNHIILFTNRDSCGIIIRVSDMMSAYHYFEINQRKEPIHETQYLFQTACTDCVLCL
ncbi:MAG: hypothetical protein J6S41_05265, partial [Clostridia bacterium]|nr:hypothetical protein [Clostridia bacterium]